MCGFSGIVYDRGFEARWLKQMNDSITHRGPDGEGYLLLDNHNRVFLAGGEDTSREIFRSSYDYSPTESVDSLTSKPFVLGLAHRRLSIIDLSPAGHQPMSYSNGRYWIVYNGEIYNFRQIRDELINEGHKFVSRTDTEVILASYMQWGKDCLSRFAGMWAFTILDIEAGEIFIARDRYGIKPLYYWFSPEGHFCFGSEIKQFTKHYGWKASLNGEAAVDYLVYSLTDHTDETMFEGVYQFPPGSYYAGSFTGIIPDRAGRVSHSRWYKANRDQFTGSFEEAADTFYKLFRRSVEEHLVADVPVGTALSGGLDSSSIVCEINKIMLHEGISELQKTFSSCAREERFDERKWMELVVNHTKVNASFVYPQIDGVFSLLDDLIWFHDEPYQSQSAFLAFNVFKLASDTGVKVLLNGQGADEYLGGYGQFTAARHASMLKSMRIIYLADDMRRAKKINNAGYMNMLMQALHHLLPVRIKRSLASVRSSSDRVKSIIDPSKFGKNLKHPFDKIPVPYNTVPQVSEHLTFYSTLPKYLRWEDRNSMANSIEARVPFLDHRLVEFAFNLPDEYLEKDGVTKRVMREALKGLLPEEVRLRKDKMGFTTPEEIWVRKDAPDLFRRKLYEAVETTEGIITSEALKYFDSVVNGLVPFDYTYWRLILFSEWARKFNVRL